MFGNLLESLPISLRSAACMGRETALGRRPSTDDPAEPSLLGAGCPYPKL